jgi:diadenosine tetraphosphatase ApaH/serine/threonine PP2A family protein phosphatase
VVYAIISDIHSNLEALRRVLEEIERRSVDSVLCLGDIVGYNADPGACVDLVLAQAQAVVRGNHDKAVVGLMDVDWFNSAAREAALWTRRTLPPQALALVTGLPEGPVAKGEGVLLCHGSPVDEDEYLVPGARLVESFRFLETAFPDARLCFHGHTHVPLAAVWPGRNPAAPRMLDPDETIEIEPDRSYLLNPGSVGQPRDGNPRASFGILDTGRGTFANIRVAYDFRETQRKIVEAGLPAVLARRLGEGR